MYRANIIRSDKCNYSIMEQLGCDEQFSIIMICTAPHNGWLVVVVMMVVAVWMCNMMFCCCCCCYQPLGVYLSHILSTNNRPFLLRYLCAPLHVRTWQRVDWPFNIIMMTRILLAGHMFSLRPIAGWLTGCGGLFADTVVLQFVCECLLYTGFAIITIIVF